MSDALLTEAKSYFFHISFYVGKMDDPEIQVWSIDETRLEGIDPPGFGKHASDSVDRVAKAE